jgi:hypothetical protein
MAGADARFEFRLFALADERDRLDGLLTGMFGPGGEPEISQAVYVLKRGLDSVNIKLRGGQLDVKRLLRSNAGLQQWRPDPPAGFPLGRETRHRLEADFGIPESLLSAPEPTAFIEAAEAATQVLAAHVHKRRRRFGRGDLIGESVLVTVNGAQLASLAIESEEPTAVRQALAMAGLDEEENVSYPLQLQRVCALIPLPTRHPWRVAGASPRADV